MKFLSKSAEDTAAIAASLVSGFIGGEVVALSGDLGAGKTAFAQGAIRSLGYIGEVTSPTFSIMNQYKTDKFMVYHIDAYRLEVTGDNVGLGDFVGSRGSITMIEWACFVKEILPSNTIEVEIKYLSDEEREININVNK